MKSIFWVDEEASVTFPDIKELQYRGYKTVQVGCAGDALDWFLSSRAELSSYVAFVIDIQLPIYDDERFVDQRKTHGTFAGLRLCELIEAKLGSDEWAAISHRFLLYTRLPDTSRMARIKEFAKERGLYFSHKDGSLLDTLIDCGLLR